MSTKPEPKMNPTDVKVGQKYRHINGNEYLVFCIAKSSEDEKEDLVIYKPLYKSNIPYWARPLSMFTGEKIVEGKPVKRFTLVK